MELIWVQFNTKKSLEHFDKHLACNTALHERTMHEHIEKCLNTWSKCHKGPTQIHTNEMGHSLIKILKIFWLKSRTQPFFKKSPTFENLSYFLHNLSGKDEKNVKNIPLRLNLQRFAWNWWGFEWKIVLGWEGFERGTAREIESV